MVAICCRTWLSAGNITFIIDTLLLGLLATESTHGNVVLLGLSNPFPLATLMMINTMQLMNQSLIYTLQTNHLVSGSKVFISYLPASFYSSHRIRLPFVLVCVLHCGLNHLSILPLAVPWQGSPSFFFLRLVLFYCTVCDQ